MLSAEETVGFVMKPLILICATWYLGSRWSVPCQALEIPWIKDQVGIRFCLLPAKPLAAQDGDAPVSVDIKQSSASPTRRQKLMLFNIESDVLSPAVPS